jgi:predicted membrane-bound mannosyltransferase
MFVAPRAGPGPGPGPGLFRPTTFPAVLEATFAGSVRKFLGVHVLGRSQAGATHELLPYVADYAGTMLATSLPLVALALVGFLADRYGTDGPTPVVAFHAYWGFATLLAVPVAAEVSAPWLAVLGAAPLAVPAAVGAARLVAVGRHAWRRADAATVAAVGLLVLSAGGHAGAVAAADVYAAPTADSRLAQYAQPTDLDPLLANVSAATVAGEESTRGGEGTDVAYVGGDLGASLVGDARQPPVAPQWGARLPLAWYFERLELSRTSVRSADGLDELARPPPVVVATPAVSRSVERTLADRGVAYRTHRVDLALWGRSVVVFTQERPPGAE